MDRRLAAYALCIEDGRVLLARHEPPNGATNWTLPGGYVEHGEDPIDAVSREVAEETGYDAMVERLLGVDSRLIPTAERVTPGLPDLHNVGIFYGVRITGGEPRPEPNGETPESVWTPFALVVLLLVLLIRGASRAANKAEAIVAAFNEARENTAGLWNVDTTNRTIVDITSSARAAREYLESVAGQP